MSINETDHLDTSDGDQSVFPEVGDPLNTFEVLGTLISSHTDVPSTDSNPICTSSLVNTDDTDLLESMLQYESKSITTSSKHINSSTLVDISGEELLESTLHYMSVESTNLPIYRKMYETALSNNDADDIFINRLITDITYDNKNIDAICYLGFVLCLMGSKHYNLELGTKFIKYAAYSYNHVNATHYLSMTTGSYESKLRLYKKNAHNNHTLSMIWLANQHYKSKPAKQLYWLRKAAGLGCVEAMNELGKIYYNDGNYTESFRYYMMSHECGNVIGTKKVAIAYKYGKGVVKNMGKSQQFLTEYLDKTKDCDKTI